MAWQNGSICQTKTAIFQRLSVSAALPGLASFRTFFDGFLQFKGKPPQFAINGNYLMDYLSRFEGKVTLSYQNAMSAIRWSIEGTDCKYIVMPMQLP